MTRILIAYASGEGQTAKIAATLGHQLHALGLVAELTDLVRDHFHPEPAAYDAVILAASVHAGRHQRQVARYVKAHRDELTQKPSAFLSVSLSAACGNEAGQAQAREQADAFLGDTGWQPTHVELVAGAFRPSRMGWMLRSLMAVMTRLFGSQLERLGWPDSGGADAEYTDWEALRTFGERLAGALQRRAA